MAVKYQCIKCRLTFETPYDHGVHCKKVHKGDYKEPIKLEKKPKKGPLKPFFVWRKDYEH